MAISTRLLLFITVITFSILSISIYIYSKNYYRYQPLPQVQVTLANGTKIPTNDRAASSLGKSGENAQSNSNLGFLHAFIASITVVVVSEIGDKTFFIAAIMAMRHSRLIIYSGAMGALGAMTILSALLGNIVTKFIPKMYTYYLSSILFACFGVKMLRDGYGMSPDEGTGEYEEVQHEVEKAEADEDLESGGGETTDGLSKDSQQRRLHTRSTVATIAALIRRYISPIFVQAFIMTFLAVSLCPPKNFYFTELVHFLGMGDRSQITTIVLAASENLLGVIIGGTIGHGFCTGLAVLGGRFVAQLISPKTVTLAGGVVFLCFALSAFVIRPGI